jgi:hypothetical protein
MLRMIGDGLVVLLEIIVSDAAIIEGVGKVGVEPDGFVKTL